MWAVGRGVRWAFRGSFGLSGHSLGQMSGPGPVRADPPTTPLSRQDQYQLCYRAALEYLGSFDHYAT